MTQNSKEIAAELFELIKANRDFEEHEVQQLKDLLNSDLEQKVNELHSAILKPPSSKEPDLLSQIREVVRAYYNASWLFRKSVWIIPSIALLISSGGSILAWIQKGLDGVFK